MPLDQRLLRHIVLLKFKGNSSEEDIKEVEEAFSALPNKIPEIENYEWGTNSSSIGLDKGFTHCFLVSFKSEEDLSVYLPHPDHKAVSEALEPYVEDMIILDYWVRD